MKTTKTTKKTKTKKTKRSAPIVKIVTTLWKIVNGDHNLTPEEQNFMDAIKHNVDHCRRNDCLSCMKIITDCNNQTVLLVPSKIRYPIGIIITSKGFVFSGNQCYLPAENRLIDIKERLDNPRLYELHPELVDAETARAMIKKEMEGLKQIFLQLIPGKEACFLY
jgi:hypothetical protein